MSESNANLLANLANYYCWAEERVQKAIDELADEEFYYVNKAIGISIRNLCEHITYNYKWHFYSSDSNEKFQEVVKKVKSLPREELMNYWTTARIAFVEAVKDNQSSPLQSVQYNIHPDYVAHAEFLSSSDKKVRYKRRKAREFLTLNWIDYFLAITDHLTYHRGQLVIHLRLLNKKGVNTDFFTYLVRRKIKAREA